MENWLVNQRHPLIPNNNNYLLDSKIVSIHSEDRDKQCWRDANNFEIKLPQVIHNVQSIRLIDIYLAIDKTLPANSGKTCVYMEIEKYNQIDELEPNPVNTNATYNNRFNGRVNSSFAVIPISSNSGSVIYQSDSNSSLSYFSPPIEQVPKIKVKFRYHDGTLVDFGNNESHFRIEFNTLTNQQQKNMTINVPEGNFI